jgi:hypothetical protein
LFSEDVKIRSADYRLLSMKDIDHKT